MNRKLHPLTFALALCAATAAYGQLTGSKPAGSTTAAKPAAAAPATPAGPAPTKIGVIDIQSAILLTNEGQRDFGALQTKFAPKKTELENMGKEIEGLQKQLDAQGDKMNPDARGALVKQIEGKKKTAQRALEDANADFDTQKNEILGRLGNKVYATLDTYARNNNYAVIVDVSTQASPVLWADNATNITKAIVDAYNATSGVAAPAAPKPAAANTPPAAPSAAKPAGSHQ